MGYAEDKGWDRYKDEPHRPGVLPRDKKIKIYGGLTVLSMVFFLALLVFF